MPTSLSVTLIVVLFVVGIALGGLLVYLIPIFKQKSANQKAKEIIEEANVKAEKIVKTAQMDGKQSVHELKQEAERDIKTRRAELVQNENRLLQREQSIDRRDGILIQKEQQIEEKQSHLKGLEKSLEKKEAQLQEKLDSIISELEKVANLSIDDARAQLFSQVEEKISRDLVSYARQREDEAIEKADVMAREIIAVAIDKMAQDVTTERTVSVVAIPNEEMKGRIIGREGRNIKSFESSLGVDLIIDDTPDVITISCFNPIRREIARITLEGLIKDGRIQPARIEELAQKAEKEVNEVIRQAGQEAAFKLGLPKINRELLDYVGRLKYRTSYGQNAYAHSMEVARLAGLMAAELGLDQNMAKRAGLLHDIGKATDFEQEGTHIEIGAKLAKKFGEPQIVINSIESHHGDVEAKSLIAVLVSAADTLSAARPGARNADLENYIQRIEQLETICRSFDGVSQAFAMQAGREVRVMVIPDKIDDVTAYKLAKDIKEKIENEMVYPGQIKISVIREYRAQEIAK